MPRLLIVSNRLPVTVRTEHRQVAVAPSAGGLATGLRGPHQRSGGFWIGWPGDVTHVPDGQRGVLEKLLAELRTVPIYLTPGEVARFYDGYSNGLLWPLFHYLVDKGPVLSRDFDAYRRVNQRFADKVAEHYEEGDLIWVHDYQLMLLPALLRERLPNARIGFFLHIPFPTSELFRALPERARILEGLLGADLIGFHTLRYMRHFATALLDVLGLESDVDTIWYGGREVRLGAYPMGIDARAFEALATSDEVLAEATTLRDSSPNTRMLLGVDRLDYTKGIRARLYALERFLEREPSWRGKVRLVQIAVPSRTKLEAYQDFRRQVEELVGRINGTSATLSSAPIHYVYRSVNERQLVAMYRSTDVMLVTPLRDGMNLVAKEFVASRVDEDGALVLSEFAGAASELGEAVMVNAYDIESIANGIKTALTMPRGERQARMRALRQRVTAYDVHRWAATFIDRLEETRGRATQAIQRPTPRERLLGLAAELRGARSVVVLADYDGTLVPFATTPDAAAPDGDLRALLLALAQRPNTKLHVMCGRTRETLESWLGDLPIGLHAENGYWSRIGPAAAWTRSVEIATDWKDRVRTYFTQITEKTPGSLLEEKATAIAWHYRRADPQFAALQARELRLNLSHMLRNAPVEFVQGDKVVEARFQHVHKTMILNSVLRGVEKPVVLALGNDRSDEELFAAIPEPGVAIHVGSGPTRAPYRVPSPDAARAFLHLLLDAPAIAPSSGSR